MAEQKRAVFAITVKGSKDNELGARIIKMGSMHVGIIKRESLGNSFVFTTEKTEINMSFKKLEDLINEYEKTKKEYDELTKLVISSTDNNSMIVELKKKKVELNKLELKLQPNTIKNKIEQLQNKLKEVTKQEEIDQIEQDIYGLTVDRFFAKIRSKFIKGVSLEEPKTINKFVESVKTITKDTSTAVKENYNKVVDKINEVVEPVNEKVDVAVKTVKYFSAKVALMKESAVKKLAIKPKKEVVKKEVKNAPATNKEELDKAFDVNTTKKEVSKEEINKTLNEKERVAELNAVEEAPKIETETVVNPPVNNNEISVDELNKILDNKIIVEETVSTKDELNDNLNHRFDHYEEESEVSLATALTEQEKVSLLDKDVEMVKPSDKSPEENLVDLKKEETNSALQMNFDKNEITEAPLKDLSDEPKVEEVKKDNNFEVEFLEMTKSFKALLDHSNNQAKIIDEQSRRIDQLLQVIEQYQSSNIR